MPVIARLGLPLLVHAELPGPIEAASRTLAGADPRRYATWLASRPPEAEVEAIRMMIRLCERHRCRVHIVHLAAAETLADLAAAKLRGLPITVETCPHYLTFAAEEIADGATAFKCAPPIRSRENRERLWRGLHAGIIDLIATDHSPCPPALKCADTGDFTAAWGGISSLELSLPVVWTEASARGFGLADLARWLSERPAALAGLSSRKGAIEVGRDADLVVWEPETEWTVDAARLQQRHPITPYVGRTLRGRVVRTMIGGA
jgi:allantoinase